MNKHYMSHSLIATTLWAVLHYANNKQKMLGEEELDSFKCWIVVQLATPYMKKATSTKQFH